MKYKCPVCGGELVKGFTLKDNNFSGKQFLSPVDESRFLFPVRFRLRARVCIKCGHVDFYIHPDDISKINS